MNKKQLSERDICTKYITPALESAGWDRNILVDQTMTNDFEHFGSAMTKIQKRQANKSYSRSKPLTIAEFDLEKGWWGGAERTGRKTTEHAWKVSAGELAERNYNLDCKNPHEVEVNHRDPQELMAEYKGIVKQLEASQQALKSELMDCLGGTA